MQSELPIPMPEIPGYQPPEPKHQPPMSTVHHPSPSAQPQWNAMYDDGMRNRSLLPPESSGQLSNVNIPGHGYGATLQPCIVNMVHSTTLNNQQPLPGHPRSSLPFRQQNQSTPHNNPHPHPHSYNAISSQPKSSPYQRNNSDTLQRRIVQPDWLQPDVPSDGFGLIGETLLCPLKVAIYILLDVFNRKRSQTWRFGSS